MVPNTPTQENKEIAKFVRYVLGGDCKVFGYADDDESVSTSIVSCVGRPEEQVTSYGTIGLSDYPMMRNGEEFSTRIEIIGVCDSDVEYFPNVIASVAFQVMKTQWYCHPGAVLKNALGRYHLSKTLSHLFFTSPFLWDDFGKIRRFGKKDVAWLLAVPISDEELNFLEDNGDEELEAVFEREQINIFDINRFSVI